MFFFETNYTGFGLGIAIAWKPVIQIAIGIGPWTFGWGQRNEKLRNTYYTTEW